jgi:hypothetical protein
MRTEKVETIVKLVFENMLPGAEMVFRDEQSHGEYDFDLHHSNGTLAAVEVTESVDQLQAQTSAEIRSKKKGGPVIKAKKCQKTWMVFPIQNANISNIRKKADVYLSSLEQAGIERFSSYLDAVTSRRCKKLGTEKSIANPVPECIENICVDLQLNSGLVVDEGGTPAIFIHHPVGGGAVGPSVAINAGERETSKEDNRKKLGAAKTDERHLVVYVDIGLPWIALTTFEPPSALPELPEEITHIWLIGHIGEANKDEFIVWGAGKNEPWYSHVVSIKPERIPRPR